MMQILILEDNEDRRAIMQDCLHDRFHQYESVFFDDANTMRDYLKANLPSALVISLDHDLELKSVQNGDLIDTGTGREVADFLASQPPSCPVIIATTNSTAGESMEFLLRDARWETHRVYPWGGLEWISNQWFPAIRKAIVGSAKPRKEALR